MIQGQILPALFVSHGAPTLPLTKAPARRFLEELAQVLPERPRAILAVSAHWETSRPAVNSVDVNSTIHDFYGFPAGLYALSYPAPGSAELAARVVELLAGGGLAVDTDLNRGLDHGAWVPLMLAFPEADIPVVQLSVQAGLGPEHHLRLGRLLAPLRKEGVLILGSGSFTHDLSSFRSYARIADAPEPDWVGGFADWMDRALAESRIGDLLDYRAQAPHAERNHPTEEHLLPLFVALGAGGGEARRLHSSRTHVILRMDVYAFGSGAERAQATNKRKPNMPDLSKWAPHALGLLRIVAGLIFLEHGTQKFLGFPGGPYAGSGLALDNPGAWAGIVEILCGILIALGLFTPAAAFLASGTMAVAYWYAHAPQDFFPVNNGGDAAILYCFVFLLFFVAGPGRWSLDGLRRRAEESSV
jgi:4,5-DOPA dioxygenase extradiol